MKTWLSTALLVLAIWQGGQGAYIYAKAALAQWLIASAWQQTLVTGQSTKPWPWADTWPVARLRLPRSDDLFVLSGDAGNSLAFGPGHLSASALPGTGGVSVIGGHRDTHFRSLQKLQLQDVIEVQNQLGEWRHYSASSLSVVDSRTTPLLVPVASGDAESGGVPSQLQLVTCYPFDTLQADGPLRYVVAAELTY